MKKKREADRQRVRDRGREGERALKGENEEGMGLFSIKTISSYSINGNAVLYI